MTWKSIDLDDFIEQIYGLVNIDVIGSLEIVQNNGRSIREMAISWSTVNVDLFDDVQSSDNSFKENIDKHSFVRFDSLVELR